MTKVVFFFAGTGDDGSHYTSMKEKNSPFLDNVIRIYIKGCQKKRVGNGFLFPDLEIAANNVRNAFEGKELNLDKLKKNFGDSIYAIYGPKPGNEKVYVDDITLEGFSRGAVTTFATAKRLDDLNIPIHIIANQPVPGEPGIAKRLYIRYCDLTGCKNIKSANTFLSSYNLEQGLIHNHFFRQMVAKFSPQVSAKQTLFPHQHHLEWFKSSPIHNHINKLMAENGLTQSLDYETNIRSWYSSQKYYFTPYEFMQTIYGAEGPIPKDSLFLDMQKILAQWILLSNEINISAALNFEQAAAICAIKRLPETHFGIETKIKFYKFTIKNDKRAEQFVKIINKVTEVFDYLPRVTQNNTAHKKRLINPYSNDYMKSVFDDSFDFLSLPKHNLQDKIDFAGKLFNAECKFRKQPLDLDGIIRTVLKILINFITHITGIGLLVNTYHKAHTGNWLILKHSRSENAVRDTRRALLSDLEKLGEDSEPSKGPKLK